MQLIELVEEVNELYYNDSSSYKTIASRALELLSILKPHTNIKSIDRVLIKKYFKTLQVKGNKPATINAKMSYLSKLLTYALQNNLIQYKPVIPYIKIKETNKQKTISNEELQAMLAYALDNNLTELYQVLVIGYNTGMRISNILAIKQEDIEDNYIRIYINKTNKPYSIPLNEALQNLFNTFIEFNLNYRQLQYQFKTMIKNLSLDESITLHTLRHTTCSELIKKNIPLPVVQKIMNHKNIATTMLYAHLKDEQLEYAVSML